MLEASQLSILREPKTNLRQPSPGRPQPSRRAAIARVSHIHGGYRPQGTMSEEDLLYIFSLFAVERFE
ncbi:hypothetical protein F4777DRAFT_534257 [Nemania sp. FL0916]|nr:hypothetical protein F4777DRAFT_534257 [Nemania sp. FL0916]